MTITIDSETSTTNLRSDVFGFEPNIATEYHPWSLVRPNFVKLAAAKFPNVAVDNGRLTVSIAGDIESLVGLLPEGGQVVRTELADGFDSIELLVSYCDGVMLLSYVRRSSYLDVLVASTSARISERRLRAMQSLFQKAEEPEPDTVRVYSWVRGFDGEASGGIRDVKTRKWSEIENNYPGATRTSLTELMEYRPGEDPDAHGKLIVWHGPPGTGKTSALRTLIGAWHEWAEPELLVDAEAVFSEPAYLFEVMGRTPHRDGKPRRDLWRVLIAEDADLYVTGHSAGQPNPALERLLNLGDGLLGQGRKLMVLLTTNAPITSLSEALTRPGRCLSINEFPRFTAAEARDWLGLDAPRISEPKSLAELFQLRGGQQRIGGTREDRPMPGQYL